MFKKILIANRGEIALRVLWACKELGVKTVAVYSEADANQPPRALRRPGGVHRPPAQHRLLPEHPRHHQRGGDHRADAIHPGYGFLSESSYLAEICEACNIKFIGPGPQAIRLMGDKSRAKKAHDQGRGARDPRVPGVVEDEEKAIRVARDIGLPGDPQGLRRRRRPRDADRARARAS